MHHCNITPNPIVAEQVHFYMATANLSNKCINGEFCVIDCSAGFNIQYRADSLKLLWDEAIQDAV